MTGAGADPAPRQLALTLGPVLFLWDEARWRDFYFRIADEADVDTVVIGETVCSKREHFHARSVSEVAKRLTTAGKTVRLASLALVTASRERKSVQRLAEQQSFEIEIGELSALPRLQGRSFAVGPMVNVYNAPTAQVLARMGARTICLPPELPLSSVAAIAAALPEVAVEVFAFGRVPLAISARCYHARLHKLHKDNCRFVCEKDPDGLVVKTLEEQDFLAINGVQTLSHSCANLLRDIGALREAGVRSLRLSPQDCDMVEVIKTFRDVLDGRGDAEEGGRRLAGLYPHAPFSNGFLHGAAGVSYV